MGELMRWKKRIVENQPHIANISNSFIHFNTNKNLMLKEHKISFMPIQEGSGDPSPSNVRAISGWSGLEVYYCNKNILDPSVRIDNHGVVQSFGGNPQGSTNGDLILPAGTYTFSTNGPGSSMVVYKKGGNYIATQYSSLTSVTFTLSETTEIGIIYIASDNSYNYQLEIGSVATEYVAHSVQTVSINWTSTAGTIYGGYVDLINNKLVQTHKKYTFTGDDLNLFGLVGNANYGGVALPEECKISSTPLASYFITLAPGGVIGKDQWYGRYNSSLTSFSFRLGNEINTETLARTYLDEHPLELCCQLITPIEYQLNLQSIQFLQGVNNIYSNSNDNINIRYWTH